MNPGTKVVIVLPRSFWYGMKGEILDWDFNSSSAFVRLESGAELWFGWHEISEVKE